MKTSYKVKRGHIWHVVHETKSMRTPPGAVWTLCGSYYEEGEWGARTPTCPNCLKVDNPLLLPPHAKRYLRAVAKKDPFLLSVRESLKALVRADYLTHEGELTRRGTILVEDYLRTPVPLEDDARVVHARWPLDSCPRCNMNGRLLDVNQMTTERYAKLRMVEDQLMVTCFQCIARGDPRDDIY
jgi:hypothetical protein